MWHRASSPCFLRPDHGLEARATRGGAVYGIMGLKAHSTASLREASSMKTFVAAFLTLLCAASMTRAATPALEVVVPRGAQKGTEVEVTFRGGRLADAEEVLLYGPGLTVTDFKAVDAGK